MVIGLLLLSGAVVNVAVAWTLVGAPDSWTPGGPAAVDVAAPFGEGPAARRKAGESLRASLWAPPSWGPAAWVKKRRGLGWTTTDVVAGGFVPDLNWHGSRIDGGWPARSMASVDRSRSDDQGEWERYQSASIEVPLHALMDSGWFGENSIESRDQIPLTPVFPGFAINTLFYATLLALPMGVSLVRRRGKRLEPSADPAPWRRRRARWLALCIIAVAMAPGASLAFMGSLFGVTLMIAFVASVLLWLALLVATTCARSRAMLFPTAVVLSIVSHCVAMVLMALVFSDFVYG